MAAIGPVVKAVGRLLWSGRQVPRQVHVGGWVGRQLGRQAGR